MKKLWAIIPILLICLFLASGCTETIEPKELTAEEYLQEVELIVNEGVRATEMWSNALNYEADRLEIMGVFQYEPTQTSLNDLNTALDITNNMETGVKSLDPPNEFEGLHNSLKRAIQHQKASIEHTIMALESNNPDTMVENLELASYESTLALHYLEIVKSY